MDWPADKSRRPCTIPRRLMIGLRFGKMDGGILVSEQAANHLHRSQTIQSPSMFLPMRNRQFSVNFGASSMKCFILRTRKQAGGACPDLLLQLNTPSQRRRQASGLVGGRPHLVQRCADFRCGFLCDRNKRKPDTVIDTATMLQSIFYRAWIGVQGEGPVDGLQSPVDIGGGSPIAAPAGITQGGIHMGQDMDMTEMNPSPPRKVEIACDFIVAA